MAPQVHRPDPPYVQVVRDIRAMIVSGQLKEGDTIPSARQITRDWGISLATATKVLAALKSEGLVRAVPGIGTVVTAPEQPLSGRYARYVSNQAASAGDLPLDPQDIADRLPAAERVMFLAEYEVAMVEAAHELWRYRHVHDVLHRWHLTAVLLAQPGYATALAEAKNATTPGLSPEQVVALRSAS